MKYYLCALLICGAFFSSYVTAQENLGLRCPGSDGTFQDHPELGPICSEPAPSGTLYRFDYGHKMPTRAKACDSGAAGYRQSRVIANQGNPNIQVGGATGSLGGPTQNQCTMLVSLSVKNNVGVWVPTQNQHIDTTIEITPSEPYCPPDESPTLIGMYPVGNGSFICWKEALDEPPEECDDIVGNCEPDPDCVAAGGGSQVCKADPDEKCWVDAFGDTQCEEGCGYVNEDFFCMTEPTDNPDFAKCKFTFNGYACPSEPDDDIPEPDKPLPDMKKQDFKDVNVGIESRQNKTNDLLETLISTGISNADAQAKADAENTKKINEGQGKSNDYLKQIDLNTKKLADALDPEETREIGEPESWYESVYEDGITGVWDEHKAIIMQAPIFEFIDQFSLAPSGSQPDWTFNLNLGAMGSYGTHRLEVPAFVWNFIRICMLLGASLTARRLIFGG